MAIVTKNYVVRGPLESYLKSHVSPSAVVDDRYPLRILKVSIDDAVAGTVDALDEVMEQIGYSPEIAEPLIEVFQRAGNPGTLVGSARIFSKAANGGTQIFVRTGNGLLVQLTPFQSPDGFAYGCVPSFVSASVVQLSTGRVRDETNNVDLVLAAPTNIDIAVAGVGGLDTGVEVANQWYYLYVIGDSTGVNPVATIMSEATGAPTYPPGYDVSRRVGSVRNQGGNFRDFVVNGEGSTRDVQYRDAITGHQVLTAGNATVVTEISLVNHIPGPSRVARIQCLQAGAVVAQLYFDPALALATFQRMLDSGDRAFDVIMPTSSTRRIAYANVAAGGLLDVWVTGYQESI